MNKNVLGISFFRTCCKVGTSALMLFGAGRLATAQTPSADLSFEVATVKPVLVDFSHPPNPRHWGAHITPAGASYWSMSIEYLISYAYEVHPFQFSGPDWTRTDHFDIDTKFPEGTDQKDNRKMLQALLKDRFKLAFHVEKKELETDVLVVGKHGAKLKPSLPDPTIPTADAPLKPEDSNHKMASAQSGLTTNKNGSTTIKLGEGGTQTFMFDQETGVEHWEASKMTMEVLAIRVSACLGFALNHVADRTEIKGDYQVTWDCPTRGLKPTTSKDGNSLLPSDPEDGSALIRSLDALGLKLEKRKIPQDVYVIDHVERPSEN